MTEISERYRRLAHAFAATIDEVHDDAWERPSPCEGWDARDLVRHVVDTQGMFLGFVGESLPPAPAVDADPPGAWTSARRAVQQRLDDPERAGAEFDGFFGRTRFDDAVDRFLCFDLVVHHWDLARAAGLDDHIDAADVAHVRTLAEGFGPAMRNPRAFGAEVEPPAGADDQTKLMAFLGRRV